VNAPLVSLQSKNINNAKSEVRFFKQLIRDAFTINSSTPALRINLKEHPRFRGPSRLFFFSLVLNLRGSPQQSTNPQLRLMGLLYKLNNLFFK
jgi:hypothetical protein